MPLAHRLALALEALVLACELPGDHCKIEQALPAARAALELSHRSLAGYALVPRIPTTAMIVAAIERLDSSDNGNGNGLFYGAIYRAMIAAAPTTEGDGR
jgi:hypothetical protein